MNSFFDGWDNHLDPDDPEHRRILEKRAIADRWEEHVSKYKSAINSDSLSDDEFGLKLPALWSAYSISNKQLAKYPNHDALVRRLQEAAMDILERRQLVFPATYAYAIANADDPDDKAIHLENAGICIRFHEGFDLNLPVAPSRETDGGDFDLLFAARLAKIAPLSVGNFLAYHLSKNFGDDFQWFKSYLQLLFLQFRSAGVTPGTYYAPILSDTQEQAVQIWLSQISQQTVNVDNRKISVRDAPAADALFAVLAPYFGKELHAPLRTLIAGGTNDTPLLFNGTGSQFVHALQEACDMGLIISMKTEVRDWIVQNFRFRHTRTKAPSEFGHELVYKILTKQIPVKRPIDISPLLRLKEA